MFDIFSIERDRELTKKLNLVIDFLIAKNVLTEKEYVDEYCERTNEERKKFNEAYPAMKLKMVAWDEEKQKIVEVDDSTNE